MPTEAERYQSILDNTLEELDGLSDPATRKPSYSVEGQKVDWTQYQDYLQKRADWARGKLKELDAEDGDELFEIVQNAYT